MESYINRLPEDKNAPIAIYCRSGRMSAISAQQLNDLGYANIYDLEGGMNAWQSSGRRLTNSQIEETGETKEFDIIAKKWEFSPETIEVNLGDKVLLHITSIDVAHGIYLSDFGINEQLPLDQTIDIEFIADKKGSFSFSCNVFCGMGHGSMKGQLIVN
jgi:cytochrome c oxidase subunit 2